MKILTFTIKPIGPVSFRLYHTFQASATYLLPPPSSIYGLLANAVLIKERCSPEQAIEEIRNNVLFVWARANKPNENSNQKLISSFWAPLKTLFWESGLKNNILAREFLFAPHGFVAHALIKDEMEKKLVEAVKSAPLYLGDSEGLVTISDVMIDEAKEVPESERISVYFPKKWGDIVQDAKSDPETEGAHIIPVNELPHNWRPRSIDVEEDNETRSNKNKNKKNKKDGKNSNIKNSNIMLEHYVFPIIKRGRYIIPTQPRISWKDKLLFYQAPNGDILPYLDGK